MSPALRATRGHVLYISQPLHRSACQRRKSTKEPLHSHLESRVLAEFEAVAATSSADARLSALAVWLAACTQLTFATPSISDQETPQEVTIRARRSW